MTKSDLIRIVQEHTEDDQHSECILAAIDAYSLVPKLPSPVDYFKRQIESILFDRKHYPFIDDTIVMRLLDEAFKEAKQIENYNNEIKK